MVSSVVVVNKTAKKTKTKFKNKKLNKTKQNSLTQTSSGTM